MSRMIKCLLLVLAAVRVQAQMPHEVLLVVNADSQPSLHAANVFRELRQIPGQNIVYLNLPESTYTGTATVSPEEFTELIWEPVNAAAKERGIDQQILAWVYSVDFPIRIKTDPNDRRQMSICGLTFTRNRIPDLSMVEEGKYFSRLFAGPNARLKVNLPSLSLGMHRQGLGEAAKVPAEAGYLKEGLGGSMPLPCMMLGYVGENGSTIDTVIETIRRGTRSDSRGVRKGIYFVLSDDVRSKCREWQYLPAVNELKERGMTAEIVTNFPAGAEQVMGLLTGTANVDPSLVKSFAPGAMAEHLTSWSAEFQKPQTKLTSWLDAGATASAGAVVEPYSNPDKFPSARFFVHYGLGCTMMESFYQSIACPLQLLLLGDPLARPYAVPMQLKVLGADRIERDFTYIANAESQVQRIEYLYSFLLDGKQVQAESEDSTFYMRALRMDDGYHELCAVARMKYPIQHSVSAVKPFIVDRKGRSVAIRPDIRKTGAFTHAVGAEVAGAEPPVTLRLVSGVRKLDETAYTPDAELKLDEKVLGEGPNRIRIIAVYEDGMEVSSEPVRFEIRFAAGTESDGR